MSDDGYEVGYGKPPRKNQFQKGRSGNPRGRPRKDKNPRVYNADDLRNCLLNAANHPVKIVQDGKEATVPAIFAIYQQTVMAAMKGDKQARRDLLKMIPIAYQEKDEVQRQYMEMILNAEQAREEAYNKMTPYEREFVRYERFKNRVGYRKLMGLERAPFEVDEPVDERDWQAYEKHMEDLKEGRPTQWPPAYWDDENPGSGAAPA